MPRATDWPKTPPGSSATGNRFEDYKKCGDFRAKTEARQTVRQTEMGLSLNGHLPRLVLLMKGQSV